MYFYIGFSYPKTFKIGAFCISLWQRSNYSHCYIRFGDTIIHSAKGSVHKNSIEEFKKENLIINEFKFCYNESIQSFSESFLKTPYGYTELLKIFIYDFLNTFKIKIKFNNSKGLICSEFIGIILNVNYQIKFDKPTYLLTPKDIYLKLEKYGPIS